MLHQAQHADAGIVDQHLHGSCEDALSLIRGGRETWTVGDIQPDGMHALVRMLSEVVQGLIAVPAPDGR